MLMERKENVAKMLHIGHKEKLLGWLWNPAISRDRAGWVYINIEGASRPTGTRDELVVQMDFWLPVGNGVAFA